MMRIPYRSIWVYVAFDWFVLLQMPCSSENACFCFSLENYMDHVQIVFSIGFLIASYPTSPVHIKHPHCIPPKCGKSLQKIMVSFRKSHESANHGARRHTTAENASLAVSWGTKVEGLGEAVFFRL